MHFEMCAKLLIRGKRLCASFILASVRLRPSRRVYLSYMYPQLSVLRKCGITAMFGALCKIFDFMRGRSKRHETEEMWAHLKRFLSFVDHIVVIFEVLRCPETFITACFGTREGALGLWLVRACVGLEV